MSARERMAALAQEVRAAIEHRLDLTSDGKLTKADIDVLSERLSARFHDEQAKHPTGVLVIVAFCSFCAGAATHAFIKFIGL